MRTALAAALAATLTACSTPATDRASADPTPTAVAGAPGGVAARHGVRFLHEGTDGAGTGTGQGSHVFSVDPRGRLALVLKFPDEQPQMAEFTLTDEGGNETYSGLVGTESGVFDGFQDQGVLLEPWPAQYKVDVDADGVAYGLAFIEIAIATRDDVVGRWTATDGSPDTEDFAADGTYRVLDADGTVAMEGRWDIDDDGAVRVETDVVGGGWVDWATFYAGEDGRLYLRNHPEYPAGDVMHPAR